MNIIVFGHPNVGKSAIINAISGDKLLVSNYPGTSVQISKSRFLLEGKETLIYDTPGIYSLHSETEAAEQCRQLLAEEDFSLILNIVDASNLEHNLPLTIELLTTRNPLVVVINQVDRARQMGISINTRLLSQTLGCLVLAVSTVTGEGFDVLKGLLEEGMHRTNQGQLAFETPGPIRFISLEEGVGYTLKCTDCSSCSGSKISGDLDVIELATGISGKVTQSLVGNRVTLGERIQNLVDSPLIGTVFLLLLAYLGFWVLVNFINFSEGPIGQLLIPLEKTIEDFLRSILPDGRFFEVLARAIPEGLVIPFSIIMPAMFMVSLVMAFLEDSGLLPRYSVALERVGRPFGVSGQAIIPLSMGLGCRTPAIMATRLLPTEGQRFIVASLLNIVVPCAATLGVMASVISAFQASLLVIIATALVVTFILAALLGRSIPREEGLIYELPPLRIPLWNNIWTKLKLRLSGFFTEILPLILLMNIGIRALMESGILNYFQGMEGFTRTLFGIPSQAFVAVLLTILQRYLAPLVLLNLPLNSREATIAAAMVFLSLPCLPAMVMTIRELGMKRLIQILFMGVATSLAVGLTLNQLLPI